MELWNEAIASYRDPAFYYYTFGSFVLAVSSGLVISSAASYFAWKDPAWAKKYKIQSRIADHRNLIWPTFGWFLFNMSAMLFAMILGWPMIQKTGVHWGPWPAWYQIAWQVIFFMYVDSFVYYWFHRALHTPYLFKKIHRLHHTVHTPWSMTAQYMHPIELLLTGMTVAGGASIIGSHIGALWAWVVVRQWTGAMGHCGYDFPFSLFKLLPGYYGPVYHDFHHSKCNGNYSGGFGWEDRAFGTLARGFLERDAELGGRAQPGYYRRLLLGLIGRAPKPEPERAA
jgi:plant 4alpha-monomethylsterol monooxygenase